jgi:phosphoribosyl 1,2-cyclic phosphodiesterase
LSIIFPLFNGSKGNATYIRCRNTSILIDAGCSAKQIEISMFEKNLNPSKLNSIFITHEHLDHIKGLKAFASRYKIPIYSSEGTILSLSKKCILNNKFAYYIVPSRGISVNEDLFIKPFSISHDCAEGFGYVVETKDERKIAFATDTGFVSDEIRQAVKGCDVIFIESNHDVKMLKYGIYPSYLKKRILSTLGHLSNEACAKELPYLIECGLSRIVLSHLSKQNNNSELAYQTAVLNLSKYNIKEGIDYKIMVADEINTTGKHILI